MNDKEQQAAKMQQVAQDEVKRALRSQDFDVALEQALPGNTDFGQKLNSMQGAERLGWGNQAPDMARAWEVRVNSATGKLQIYLPAGTSCLFLNANPVPPATTLSLVASTNAGSEDYYDCRIADSAGPLVLYRWFEPASGADGRWLLSGHGQWNMAAWSSGALPFPTTGYVIPTIVAVKTADGVWVHCDSGCSDFSVTCGDAECALGAFGGTTIPSAPKSIDNDGGNPPGSGGQAQQLYRLQAGSLGTLSGPAAEKPGDLVVCAIPNPSTGAIETGLKECPAFSSFSPGDWTVSVDDPDAPSVLQQKIPAGSWAGAGTTIDIIGILPL